MTFHAERMIYMSKKMINETTDVVFNPETGKYEVERTHQFATLSTEDKFFKFYYEGLVYMSDMPLEYHRVLYALLDNMSYVDQKVEGLGDYGMHIFLNADIKRAIAKSLGLKNYRCIDNAIQMLLKGEVLIRVGKGIFRPNPNIIARGAWREISHLREECNCPLPKGETFKSVCARKDSVKKQIAEMAAIQAEHQAEQLTIDGI